MYFAIAAGGTAGHVNPAIAVALELEKRGHEIVFFGTPDHIEAKLAKEAGFNFVGLDVAGFDKAHPATLFTSTNKILKATSKVKAMFSQRRPDAVVTFGAYVSLPVGRAAKSCKIPLVIHEQNSVAGMANKYLSKKADVVALGYKAAESELSTKGQVIVVGNPVRESFEHGDRDGWRKRFGVSEIDRVLLVFGGSLGAAHLNSAICTMKEDLLKQANVFVVQSTGEKDFDNVIAQLDLSDSEKIRWKVMPYINDMANVLAASDLVVSRAGASSVAEIMTMGTPAILVPYPHARGNHQELNAAECVEVGAAKMVKDVDLDHEDFKALVMELLENADERHAMRDACTKMSGGRARQELADIIERLAAKNT